MSANASLIVRSLSGRPVMRILLLSICTFVFASAHVVAGEQKAAQITFPNRPRFNTSALSPSERRQLEQVKPGITRKQLAEHFAADGGLIFPFAERYYLRDIRLPQRPNTVVMLDVAFKPAAMDEATFSDPRRRVAWIHNHDWSENSNDIVKAFSKPYESGIAID